MSSNGFSVFFLPFIRNHQKLEIRITSTKSIHMFPLILSDPKWSPHFNSNDIVLEGSSVLSAEEDVSACEPKHVHSC